MRSLSGLQYDIPFTPSTIIYTHSPTLFSWLAFKIRFLHPPRPSPAQRIKSSKPGPCTQPPAATDTTTTDSLPLVLTVPSSTRTYRTTASPPGFTHIAQPAQALPSVVLVGR
jgi:hypothetical protein